MPSLPTRFIRVTSILVASINSFACLPNTKKENMPLPPCNVAYMPEHANAQMATFFEKIHRQHGFNGNVLVAQKGRIIYKGAWGWANYLKRIPLKTTTPFELASVSKPLTATAILLLCEQGKLKLSQTVDQFFPQFPYKNIRIDYLLSHRSGLTNYVYFTERVWPNKKKSLNNDAVINLFAQYKPGRYASENTQFHYNNTNYMLLAAIIAKVSGMPYHDFMAQYIFKPAGMVHTMVRSTYLSLRYPDSVAVGHDRTWQFSAIPNYLDGPYGDKGIYSTIDDLFRFDYALKHHLLLRKTTLAQAYFPHNPITHRYFSYGYGWRTFDNKKTQVVYHTGWWHGFRNLYVRDLTNDITIVILSNLVNGSLNKLDHLFELLGMPIIRREAY